MFHRYVLNSKKEQVDIDRASHLMDEDLRLQTLNDRPKSEQDNDQWFWDYYCQRHYEKYKEFFAPDINAAVL